MRRVLLAGLVAALTCLIMLSFIFPGSSPPVPLAVTFALTDEENRPLAGVPVRLVFGGKDWQSADAGVRVVTAEDGSARFTTPAVIRRRWSWVNVGFTPFSMPLRADHIAIALELPYVIPRREGGEATHQFLYTARIDRLPDGDCSTDDLDDLYAAAADGAFTTFIGANAAGPNFNGMIDGWNVASAGYKLSDFMLTAPRSEETGGSWRLKLGIMRRPKPVMMEDRRP
ncbi:MAG: hypothetical protein JO000_07490 [Alphaproteobacteria bacterium]|nr:hypothetical protein [Alphaproteobacteria bacterium]